MSNKINDCYIKGRNINIKLPVPPSSYSVSSPQENINVNLYKFGDTIVDSRSGQRSISFSSFFTDKDYSFNRNKEVGAWKAIRLIESLKATKEKMNIVITNTEIGTDSDFLALIDDFSYSTRGDGDIDFSITFKEARKI